MNTFTYAPGQATVSTDKGPVRGYIWNGITVFKGIPYAKAKRFHAPEPMEPWTKVFDAGSFGYVCPLLTNDRPNGEIMVPHRFWPMDEDCLNLNVWTPGTDDKKRPVLVWLHGGGYEAGSAIEHIAYEGENMARFGDAVVVTVNHRLNCIGYLDLSSFGPEYANSGNRGGEDLIASLQWVHNNIAAFGGDPDNVTIFGQSGGGGKVTTLLQSPAADGLYAKGIVMSGVLGPLIPDAKEEGRELVLALLEETGAKDVKELETIPYRTLADAYLKVRETARKEGRYTGGCPHINDTYRGNPAVYGFRKETENVPLMVGSVFGEFSSFAPFAFDKHATGKEESVAILEKTFGKETADVLIPLFKKAYPERNLLDLINLDTVFRGPEIDYIRIRANGPAPVYSYLFNQDMPVDGGRTPWHCADIPFFFHNTAFTPYTTIEGVTERLETQIFESAMAFARTGNPDNAAIPHWPACTPEEEAVMVFDAQTSVRKNYDHELIAKLGAIQMEQFLKRRNGENTEDAEDVQIQH